ncbi:hypothetical protein RND71_001732 [Anisodus tanguticus]|uniref:Uncharacterized protein n=1 Tax=Anisodus tanguticus TaxID=243964 RepID=A0AAE1VYM6_9SOLA|nr:hypothetical protein RND71_001732 [Anisodus tanguticus]
MTGFERGRGGCRVFVGLLYATDIENFIILVICWRKGLTARDYLMFFACAAFFLLKGFFLQHYKSIQMDMKTNYGGKISVDIPDDIDRVVGDGARDIANYCGLIV